jgi:uncharacterized membrane protein YeaQ/YmgE (transglycosylase-associated protein family)
MVGLIITLLIGAFCGWLASKIMGTAKKQSWIVDIVVGVIGSFIGAFVISLVTDDGVTSSDGIIPRIIVGTIGAIILLALIKAFTGKK